MHQTVSEYHIPAHKGKPAFTLDDLGDSPIWVSWRADDKGRKLPLNPATGRAAASDDPATWATRKAAQRRAQRLREGQAGGVGVMLAALPMRAGWRLAGVDLDGCLDPDTGHVAPWASAVLERFPSYAERSPSGTGLHVLFLCCDSDLAALKSSGLVTEKGGAEFSRGDHVEVALYLGGRYFTVTGDQHGADDLIRPVPRAALEWLTSEHGPSFKAGKDRAEPKGGDESGSGIAYKSARDLARFGMSEEEAAAALEEDEGGAGDWWRRVDQRQRDRALARAFDTVATERDSILEAFDDLSEPEDDPDAEIDFILGVASKPERKDPIAHMNRRHAVVALPNRTAIATFRPDGRVEFSGEKDLRLAYANKPFGKDTLAGAWLKHKDRRTYKHGLAFDPTGQDRPGVLNLWTGWALKPNRRADCGLILDHIRDVICSGNPAHFRYVVGWLADLVQNPGRKPGVALVLKGGKGAGKDTLAVVLSKIIGQRHVAHIDQPDQLTARFNAPFATAILAHVEEAFWAGARDRVGVLQARITAATMPLERKGVDPIEIDSFVRFLLTTNEAWAVPATADERRYAVFDVSDARIGDRDYFRRLYAEIEGDGAAGFLAYLLGVDLAGFDVREVPQTRALLDQKIASLQNLERWWFEVLWEGSLPDSFGFEGDTWADEPQDVERSSLRSHYESWLASQRFQGAAASVAVFGKRLKAVCPDLEDTRPWRKDGPRPMGYRFPSLIRCRELFNAALHGGDEGIEWEAEQSRQSHELH